MKTIAMLLLTTIVALAQSCGSKGRDVDPPGHVREEAPWTTFAGDSRDTEILLNAGGGFGGGSVTCQLSGGGTGTVERKWPGPPPLPDNAAPRGSATADTISFTVSDYVNLLNRFYEIRFFEMKDDYTEGYLLDADEGGQLKVRKMTYADTGEGTIEVRLGSYSKKIHYVGGKGSTPQSLGDVIKEVIQFAESGSSGGRR